MRFKKKKDRRDKQAVDRIAACLILEAFQKENACE
jgi:RNase H-fold protein (predicted Holliday junction resolvase)